MKTPILNSSNLEDFNRIHPRKDLPYKAMYSSLWRAITLDPNAMLIPIDDHLVHRGDGVFEAFRSYNEVVYDMNAHLERLEKSAAGIELPLPMTRDEIRQICLDLGKASQCANATFRLYVSRGPGGFTTNPYESIGSQLYIVVTETKPYPEALYQRGVSVGISQFKTKEAPFCHIKNCNYLINVLMKKEAVDRKLDYTVSLDPKGFIAESSTENIALLNQKNELIAPTFDFKLRGTTLLRCFDLANSNKEQLGVTAVRQDDLSIDDFKNAKEVMMIGTTMGVMPVSTFDGLTLKPPSSESFSIKMREILKQDILSNKDRRDEYSK
ncbi:peptidase [bacterium]|nr:peptidase [bacterium]